MTPRKKKDITKLPDKEVIEELFGKRVRKKLDQIIEEVDRDPKRPEKKTAKSH